MCEARFADPKHMRRHIENLHNAKSFNCVHCAKSFASDSYLKQHLQTHNAGAYICPLCPTKHFSLTTTLRGHIKTNHPEIPLPAPGTKLKNFDWGKTITITPIAVPEIIVEYRLS